LEYGVEWCWIGNKRFFFVAIPLIVTSIVNIGLYVKTVTSITYISDKVQGS
jgi:hypothetical protein